MWVVLHVPEYGTIKFFTNAIHQSREHSEKSHHFLFIENAVGPEPGLVTYPNRQVGSERVAA